MFFVPQTKKYVDVIIPRGVDNMGEQQIFLVTSLNTIAPQGECFKQCSLVAVAINLIVQHIQDILNGDICKWQRGAINGRSLKRAISEQNDLHNGVSSSTGKRPLLEPSCRPHWGGEDGWMLPPLMLLLPSFSYWHKQAKTNIHDPTQQDFSGRASASSIFTVIFGAQHNCVDRCRYVTVFRNTVFHFQLPISNVTESGVALEAWITLYMLNVILTLALGSHIYVRLFLGILPI